MNKREVQAALRAAARVATDLEFVIIGSQAVHAHCRRPPAEVLLSQECDMYPRNHPQAANLVESKLGRKSAFARRHGFYVDVVAPELATLPEVGNGASNCYAPAELRACASTCTI